MSAHYPCVVVESRPTLPPIHHPCTTWEAVEGLASQLAGWFPAHTFTVKEHT